ncbi:MAG: SDR family oxidoreductase [Lachnospiraceae bacterium]|nr:SDR family oxidoreductase [Lachnospiraceae bacterium]
MDLHLEGKTVVVTGGGTGIGRAIAREFLREGAVVAVLGRREGPLRDFWEEAKAEGFDLFYDTCDVTDREAVCAFADNIVRRFGKLDVWVNNAGIGINKRFLDFTDADFDQIVSINMKAVFQCTQIAAEKMKQQGGGVILNATSFNAKLAHANGVLYAATKAAVTSMTKSTAAALAPFGIRVLGYLPGMIVTPISEEMVRLHGDQFKRDISLNRLGTPEDLAKPIVFMASDAASYMTGVDVEISGGKFAVQNCRMAWDMEAEAGKTAE